MVHKQYGNSWYLFEYIAPYIHDKASTETMQKAFHGSQTKKILEEKSFLGYSLPIYARILHSHSYLCYDKPKATTI